MKFTVIGSGFGLYGYVPALLVYCNQQVLLPERYRSKFAERDDIRDLSSAVDWYPNDEAVRREIDAVVITQRPSDQASWIERFLAEPNIKSILLEKPLANTPDRAFDVLNVLALSGKKYRIGYLFCFMPWFAELKSWIAARPQCQRLSIVWTFRAHHYAHNLANWKRYVSQGGGALRFFGIHLIGALAELGYSTVLNSRFASPAPDECTIWFATFTGAGLPECMVLVDTNSDDASFTIDLEGDYSAAIRLSSPLATIPSKTGFDPRVETLAGLCRDLIDNEEPRLGWYDRSLDLWKRAEAV